MFELNRPYSTKELAQELHITYQVMRNRRQKILDNLKRVCNFEETTKGRAKYYTITEQWDEYISISKSKQHLDYIRDRLKYDILVKPNGSLQTAANIGEIVADDLNLRPGTAAKQASDALKQFYGANLGECGPDGHVGDKKVWAYHLGQTWYRLPENILDEIINEFRIEQENRGIGTFAEVNALADMMDNENKSSIDELNKSRMCLLRQIIMNKCAQMDWRWIMKVKEYLVHEVEED